MKKYKIRQTSPLLWIISLLLTIFIGGGIIIAFAANGMFPKGQPILFAIIFIPIVVAAFYIPRFTATVEIEIIIDNNGIEKNWLKQFMFCNRPDIKIKWTEINDFVFEPDRQFDRFKITLKNGSKIKFYHNNDHDGKDDFISFLTDFENKVKELNSDQEKSNDIKRGKTIYETVWGLILAGFAIVMLIGIPILLFALPTSKTPNYGLIGISYAGAIFFLIQVIIHRQKYGNEKK
jgi:hypothetical protein